MKQRIVIALGVAAGAAAIAYAQARPTTDPMAAPRMHDHAMHEPLTRAAAEKMVADHFATIDRNHDGVVTRDELAAAARAHRDKMRAFMEARMKDHREHAFDRLDTNHDGSISRAEFAAAGPTPVPAPGPEGAAMPLPPPGAGPMPMAGHDRMMMKGAMMNGPMMPGGMGEHWFERADANHDDKVTLAEANAAALARFDQLDTNHDGTIEPEERRMAFRGDADRGRGSMPHPGATPTPRG